LGKSVIPIDKKIRTIAVITIIVIAIIGLSLFFTYNTAGEEQPYFTIKGSSNTAKGKSAGSSGSSAKKSADNKDISIYADEYSREQLIFAAEQYASQRGQSAMARQYASQRGQSAAAGQRFSQTGSIPESEQSASQQGQSDAAEQLLSQTESILTFEQAALQQGLSAAAKQFLSQARSILTSEQAALQQGLSVSASRNTGGTDAAITTDSKAGQIQQNEAGFAIFQREFQNAGRTVPVRPTPVPVQRIISASMVLISSGSLKMETVLDQQDTDENADLRHVAVDSFYISKYEVTQREYQNVMKNNPSYFKGPNLPVENVSWFDAIEYCNAKSRSEGLTLAYTITGSGNSRIVTWNRNANGYGLPTEEEWVYACRANTTTNYNTGKRINRDMSNYFGRRTVNVGSYPPNAWELYDMHGNVSEWCWNFFLPTSDTVTRIIRGGSWLNSSLRLRLSFRDHYFPQMHTMSIGFRVVQNYMD
jgi:formylglycine-generating enzyme required for sulfatase activity